MKAIPKRRFQRKLAAIVVLLAVIPVIAIGLVLVDVNRSTLRDRSQELLFAVTDDIAHATSGALDDARRQLLAVAAVLGNSSIAAAERIASARALVDASGQRPVAIYDEHGTHIDSIVVPGMSWHGDPTLSEQLRQQADSDGVGIGSVMIVDGSAAVPYVVPVLGAGTRWYAATVVSLAPLADRLLAVSRDRFEGKFEAVSVVDASHRYIVNVDPEKTLALAQLDILRGVDDAAIRSGILVYHEVGSTVGVVRSLPGLPWAVVAQMPRATVYAALDRARRLVVLAVVIAAVLALCAALVWSWRAARPIRALVDAAEDLGRRRFDRTISVRTGDELETLGDAMASAAHELQTSERQLQAETAIRTQLGRYLPDKLVERIVAEPAKALGGGRRKITVLFADIAAFTALAEREPPDRVVALLNELFTMLTEIVFRHDGTVDKLIGDCLMAFWGAPDDQADHAKRAVAAAIDMQRWLDVANDCWETSLGLTIHVAIGVHSGDAIVGNLGSEARMEYTCVGDTVNVAARLESLARPQQILISEATRAELDAAVRCARIGKRQLPGRMSPVELHEVIL